MPDHNFPPPCTVRELAEETRTDPKVIYEEIARGNIKHTRLGRKILIPGRERERILNGEPA